MNRPLNRAADPRVARVGRADVDRFVQVLDLSRNEGDLPPEDLFQVLQELGPEVVRNYPTAAGLEKDYAALVGLQPEQVLAGNGGDEAIDRIFRAYMQGGGASVGGPVVPRSIEPPELVVASPTFAMIPSYAQMSGAKVVTVEYEWGRFPVGDVLRAVTERTRVVAVISPDNPTGYAVPTEELLDLADHLADVDGPSDPLVLLVDQAYIDFADDDPLPQLLERPNIIVIRTLSKAWGMAGLRVGFALSQAARIRDLRTVGAPYPVAGPCIAIARSRLATGLDRKNVFVADTKARRGVLTELLKEAGGEPVPSQTNFVLSRFPDVRRVREGLSSQGILTRWFPHLPDYLRFTVPRSDRELSRLRLAMQALKRPEALLFDMDGVLADVGDSYRAAIQETCSAFGVSITADDIAEAKARGQANDDWVLTWNLVAQRVGDPPTLEAVTEQFEELYQGTSDQPGLRRHESLIPDRELLIRMAESFAMAIVTGRPRADAERFLRDEELQDLFPCVVCREDAPLKPDPAPVLKAMQDLGVRTAWMLGDTPDDLVAARGAGAIPVGVVPPGSGNSAVSETLLKAGAAFVLEASGLLDPTRQDTYERGDVESDATASEASELSNPDGTYTPTMNALRGLFDVD